MPSVCRSRPTTCSSNEDRRERLAVVLADLVELESRDAETWFRLVKPRLDFSAPVRVGVRGDVPAIAFACPTTEAATVCDVLRSKAREAGVDLPAVWVYRKSWSRVPDDAVLTAVVAGQVVLNPATFAAVEIDVEVVCRPVEL